MYLAKIFRDFNNKCMVYSSTLGIIHWKTQTTRLSTKNSDEEIGIHCVPHRYWAHLTGHFHYVTAPSSILLALPIQ